MKQVDLFNVEPTLSPRLQWMHRHNISVAKNPAVTKALADEYDEPWQPYEAWAGEYSDAVDDVAENGEYNTKLGIGATVEDALADFARRAGLKLWHEETAV